MRRKFRISTESVFGVRDATPAGTSYLPMDTPNSFRPMTHRPFWKIQDGSGLNVPRLRGSEIYQLNATLDTRCYWENVHWVAGLTQRCSGGPPSTLPWPTDQRNLDLPSATIDFGFTNDDDTWNLYGYLGCKVAAATFSTSNDPSAPFLMVSHELVGKEAVPNIYNADAALTQATFADPGLAALPANAVTFQESALSYNGVVFPYYSAASIKIANTVKPYYDNGRFPNRIHCRGRTVTITLTPLLMATAMNPRARYEAVQALSAGLTLTFTNPIIPALKTIGDVLKFDFRAASLLDSVEEQMIMDEDAYAPITATAHLDSAAGDDFTITWTPAA